MKNNKKKKVLILTLLLFAVIGLAGYGVYSYYYTEGRFSGSDDVSITAFDPTVTINGNSEFLGSGGSVTVNCPNTIYTSGNESLTCTGSVLVSNNSDIDITVEVLEPSSGGYQFSQDFDATISSPSFSWNSKTIAGNDSATLEINVPVELVTDFGSSEAVNASDSSIYHDLTGEIIVSFKLKATQVHD